MNKALHYQEHKNRESDSDEERAIFEEKHQIPPTYRLKLGDF